MLQRRVGGTRALAHSIWCFNQIYRCFSWFRHHSTCLNHQRTHPSTHHPRPAHHPRNGPEFGRFRPASRSPKALLNCFTKLFQSFRVFQSFNNVCQLSQFSKHSTGLSFWGVLYSQTNKVFRYPICIRTLYIYISLLSGSWWHFPHENCHKMIANLPPPNFCRAPLSNTEELMEHQVRSHTPMVNEDVCTRWRPSFLAKLVYFTWG